MATRHHAPTLAALSVLAFITADLTHEAMGHGGMCLALGRHITRLSSVYFHCSQGGPLTDAAGPLMNLAVGGLCWALARRIAPSALHWRVLLALAMAFNLFWGSGYLIYSAVTDSGDWSYPLHDLGLQPVWLWRGLMAAAGLGLYYQTLRLLFVLLPAGLPLALPYLVAAAVSCTSTLAYAGPLLPALREAAQESLGAAVGLLILAPRMHRAPPDPAPGLTPDLRWLWAAGGAWLLFAATMGHGWEWPG
jgi:hypothetical protein